MTSREVLEAHGNLASDTKHSVRLNNDRWNVWLRVPWSRFGPTSNTYCDAIIFLTKQGNSVQKLVKISPLILKLWINIQVLFAVRHPVFLILI